jgi:GNAT superfamily N-acetyltransferase
MSWNNYAPIIVVLIVICSITICIQGIKKMNNHQEQKSGSFFVQDKNGAAVVLEWHKTNIVSPDFAALMKDAWTFARDAYVPVEMDFLKAFPEVVGTEPYFAPFEPLFREGIAHVDWNAAEKIMETILKGHFVFDPAQFPQHVVEMFGKDISIVVAVKEQSTGKMFGFITFLIRANYAAGNVKVMSFAVDVAHQKRGLGKLLMSSIFKIVSDINRIFLCTRVTNTVALNAYRSWGFMIDEKPVLDHAFNLQHWTFMEYKTDHSDILQQAAERLSE